jgi:hypothetical protein
MLICDVTIRSWQQREVISCDTTGGYLSPLIHSSSRDDFADMTRTVFPEPPAGDLLRGAFALGDLVASFRAGMVLLAQMRSGRPATCL